MAQAPTESASLSPGHKSYRFGDFVLDVTRGVLFRGQTEITLRKQAYDMLLLLVRHHGELVSKKLLLAEIWGDAIVTENSITQCLKDVRLAIGDHDLKMIRTVPRRGYIFDLPVSGLETEAETVPGTGVHSRKTLLGLAATLILAILAWFIFGSSVSQEAVDTGIVESTALQTNSETSPGTPSLAVLPFLDLSPQGDFAYFSDGLTEDITALLSGHEELKVVARTSSFYYKDKLDQVPLDEIARQLRVSHLLEGSVRKDNDRIRVTAQLIRADDGFHLWSNTWDRDFEDIFAIQDEIAAAVTDELSITLLDDAGKAAVVETESYELALQGRYLFNRRGEGDLENALEFFERATELDPGNAMAWVGLVPLYFWLFDPPRLEDALLASKQAVELDRENPEAWSRRAQALGAINDMDAAKDAWNQAKKLGENNALIQSQVAGMLAMEGDIEGAVAAQKRAVALDPLYLTNLGNLAQYQLLAGRLDEASDNAEKMLKLAPDNPLVLITLAKVALLEGRAEQAREIIDQNPIETGIPTLEPTPIDFWNALIEHSLGHDQAADAALQRLTEEEGDQNPINVAFIHAWRNEADPAFAWLDKALQQDPQLHLQWFQEPWLDSLRDDPRWERLMTRWKAKNPL